VEIEAVARRIWPRESIRLEALGGGITNENFKVVAGDDTVVLRIGGKDTELLGIDRSTEHVASLAAAETGLGPEVVDFVEPEGYLITRFIEGRPIPVEEMRTQGRIVGIARALHGLHYGKSIPGRFDSFRVVEDYRAIAKERGVEVPPAYDRVKATAGTIERARGPQQQRPCHNDLLNANFLDDGRRIRIVDWEYAGMGDPFFDLANFSVNHGFATEEDAALLESYFGVPTTEQRSSLALMKPMSDFREAMWAVVQQGISELDFDFVSYADEHFERSEEIAAGGPFKEALERLG